MPPGRIAALGATHIFGDATRARAVPIRRPICWAVLVSALCLAACGGAPDHVALSRLSPHGQMAAEVRLTRCGETWCHSLWAGPTGAPELVATLAEGQRATEVTWSPDSTRVAFLVDEVQLRLYAAATRAPAGQLDLVARDRLPTSRVARGVTFSENGAAVTFDDCPRDRSGCRPGMAALR